METHPKAGYGRSQEAREVQGHLSGSTRNHRARTGGAGGAAAAVGPPSAFGPRVAAGAGHRVEMAGVVRTYGTSAAALAMLMAVVMH